MTRLVIVTACIAVFATYALAADKPQPSADSDGWISLFDGKTLDGWKVGKNADSFKVQDGMIVVNGPVAHLFYMGDVKNHDFKNFAVKADIMTFPQANSGFYFHTQYQEAGFPKKGFEVQVNNSHKDPKRTAGLYNVLDVYEVPAKDNTWFTMEIIVRGKHIVTKVNGKTYVDYTESDDWKNPDRRVDHGTFALQGHDPGSKVYYKNILVKPLPD
jgi:hypothetical protein